jgi:hypothetical protein
MSGVTNSKKCWKIKDGRPVCNGDTICYSPWVSIPIVLAFSIEIASHEGLLDCSEKSWHFPDHLAVHADPDLPLVRYQLNAFVSYSSSRAHFRTHFRRKLSIYRHDGKQNFGRATQVDAQSMGDIVENEGSDWTPVLVLYSLCGGLQAQRHFRRTARLRLERQLQLEIRPGKNGEEVVFYRRMNYHLEEDAWKEYRCSPLPDHDEYVISPWYGPDDV